MKRLFYQEVIDWKGSADRKPLVLLGARQVGKTHLLEQFGKEHFQQVVYANFEEDLALHAFFEDNISPEKIIQSLELYYGIKIDPDHCLIIFDEIQECSRALISLKYFCESRDRSGDDYFIVAAGSLLGLKVGKESGFPVGKVQLAYLYPLSFSEFLWALGKEPLADYIKKIAESLSNSIPEPIHDQLSALFRLYMFMGGMPEAVKKYCLTKDLNQVREIQESIIRMYEFDFAKHAPSIQVEKITQVWHSMPNQLAKENKKFIFSVIRSGARAREYEFAIQWLVDAGLLYRSTHISVPRLPLTAYSDGVAFKLFVFDVGLLGAMSGLNSKAVLFGDVLFTEFKGALAENVVAQSLKISGQKQLFYWTSGNTAEVDFLILQDLNIIPLEVKSGKNLKTKSLHFYDNQYHPPHTLRASPLNIHKSGQFCNVPLYLVELLPDNLHDL